MEEVILISDPRVLAYPAVESREPLVDLADYPEFVLSAKRRAVNQKFSMVRQGVAERLLAASRLLPATVRFLIEEGVRTAEVQRIYYRDHFEKLRAENPAWSVERIRLEVAKYVAHPEEFPPHCTGAAIDVSLYNLDAETELEFGATSDEAPEENQQRGFTGAANISDSARKNRELLVRAMMSAEFVNYPTEWWHWSYGDRYWAFSLQAPHAVYDLISW